MRAASVIPVIMLLACGARSPAPEVVPGSSIDASVQRSRVLVPLISILRPGGTVAGVTLGSTIYVRKGEKLTAKFVAHELCHVEQWEEHGLIRFPIKYLIAVILPGNRFERECNRAEEL